MSYELFHNLWDSEVILLTYRGHQYITSMFEFNGDLKGVCVWKDGLMVFHFNNTILRQGLQILGIKIQNQFIFTG